MSKELLMDDILKEKAKNENVKLPKDLDIKIDKTLLELPHRSKSKRGKGFKRFVTAAGIALTIITCFSVAFPTYARNIPIVKSVLEFLGEKNIRYKDYIEYSSDLNLSDTSNGVKVTINSIVYDGIYLSIAYTYESKDEIIERPYMMHRDLKINGSLTDGFSTGSGRFLDKNTYMGVYTISVSNDYIPEYSMKNSLIENIENIDDFTMDLNIKAFSNDIWGDWKFKLKVPKNEMVKNINKVDLSVDLSEVREGLKANEVIFTPINTILRLSENNSWSVAGGTAGSIGNFIVVDDKGRNLRSISGEGYTPSSDAKEFYSQEQYRGIYKDTNSVTFIPVVSKKDERHVSEYEKNEVLLNNEGETILSYGNLGEYIITKVEFLEDKTLVHYKCTGFIETHYGFALSMVDSDGKEYKFATENLIEGDNEYIAEIEALPKDKQYKLTAPDYGKIYEVKEDLKFTVDVK